MQPSHDVSLAPRPPVDEPSIDTFLAGKVKVDGPNWWLALPECLRVEKHRYPETMEDWQKSGLVPAKFWEVIEFNQLNYLCCRHLTGMTAAVYKTDPRLPHPDIFNAKCACGRNHIRIAHDPVKYGINETEEDKLANARSIFHQPFESGVNYG